MINKKDCIWGVFLFIFSFVFTSAVLILDNNFILNISMPKLATVLISEAEVVSDIVPLKSTQTIKSSNNIKLAFVGDIMLDRGVKNSVYKNFSGDYFELFKEAKNQLKSYDILFANLEGPISDNGNDVGGIYSFRMEPAVVPILKDVGFDIFSVANNHTFNWGEEAFIDTLNLLTKEGIMYTGGGFTGREAYEEKVININGVKIAFLAFSGFLDGVVPSNSSRPGLALISSGEITESVSRVKQNNDLVIVAYHFGEEYQATPNTYQRKYAELAIDSGADLIVGYHPHVIQTLEKYKNTHIIYSLGNFIFDQYFSEETMQGGLLEVEVDTKSKQIEKVNLKKVFLNNYFQIEKIK